VSLSSIKRRKKAWKTGRVDALAAKAHPRPACKLSEQQKPAVFKKKPIIVG
jgi:hypothetical protein